MVKNKLKKVISPVVICSLPTLFAFSASITTSSSLKSLMDDKIDVSSIFTEDERNMGKLIEIPTNRAIIGFVNGLSKSKGYDDLTNDIGIIGNISETFTTVGVIHGEKYEGSFQINYQIPSSDKKDIADDWDFKTDPDKPGWTYLIDRKEWTNNTTSQKDDNGIIADVIEAFSKSTANLNQTKIEIKWFDNTRYTGDVLISPYDNSTVYNTITEKMVLHIFNGVTIFSPIMTSDITTSDGKQGYEASSGSVWDSSDNYKAYKAFTRSYLNGSKGALEWESAKGKNTDYLQLKLPQQEKLKMYDIWSSYYPRTGDSTKVSCALSGWKILGSDTGPTNDGEWATIQEVTSEESKEYFKEDNIGPQKATFITNSDTPYRYYRLRSTGMFGWDSNYSAGSNWKNTMVGDWVLYK